MRDTPEWRNWQTRLTQNQVLRSVGSSPTSGTNAKAAGKLEAFLPLFAYLPYAHLTHPAHLAHPRIRCGNNKGTRNRRPTVNSRQGGVSIYLACRLRITLSYASKKIGERLSA